MSSVRAACPDGGTCHHDCPWVTDSGHGLPCYRVLFCGALSGYNGGTWTEEQRLEHRLASAQRDADDWNEHHPVGTRVRYWPGIREGEGVESRTRSASWVMPSPVAVVAVEGYAGGINLMHVEPIPEALISRLDHWASRTRNPTTEPLDADEMAAVSDLLASTANIVGSITVALAEAQAQVTHLLTARRATVPYEDLVEMTFEQRKALAPRFHRPVWDGLGQPHSWICAVCWDEGLLTSWPCEMARREGGLVAEAIGAEAHS